jgi:hypothetical protein
MAKINTSQVGVGGPGTNIDPLQQLQQQGLQPDGTPSQEGVSFEATSTTAPAYSGMPAEKIALVRNIPGFEEEVSAFDTYQAQMQQYNSENLQPLRQPPATTPNETFPLGDQPQVQVGQNFLAENIRTPEGELEPLDKQIERQNLELNRANAAATQNNLGTRLKNSQELRSFFSPTFQKPQVDNLVREVLTSGLKLNELDLNIKTSQLDPGRSVSALEYMKEKYSASETEVALFAEDTHLGAAKILLSVQDKVDADENGFEFLDLGGETLGDSTFQTTNGLTVVEAKAFEGFLAANFNGRMVEATQQPNNPDEPMGRALARSGVNKDYYEWVDGYQPVDGEGVAKGPKISGYAMTVTLKMQNDKYRDYANLSPIRVGAAAATNNSVTSMGSLSLFQKRDTPRPKGDLAKKLKNSTGMFSNFTSTLSNAFRIHSNPTLQADAGFISDAKAYDQAYMNGQEITNTMSMLNAAAEKFYKLKPWSGAKLNSQDPEVANQEKQRILESRSRKLKLMANQVADAANLNVQLPNGHKVGGGVFVDPSAMRNYVYAYNSSEQNSTIMRGSLKGYSSQTLISRMKDKSSSSPLLTLRDLTSQRNKTRAGGSITAADREILFLLMLGREMANVGGESGRTRTDEQLLALITPAFVRDIALKGRAIKQYAEVNADPKKLTNAVEAENTSSMLDPAQNNALQGALFAMSASPKHHGAVQQMLEAADSYVNAEGSSSLMTFNVFPDMSSAGRLNAVFNADGHLGAELISRMGYYLSQEYTDHRDALPPLGSEAGTSPIGNPRLYVAESVIHSLQNSAESGDMEASLAGLLEDLFTTEMGASLADTFMKTPAMVVDYGMAISGAGKVAAGLFSKLIKEADDSGLNASTKLAAMADANNVTMAEITDSISRATAEALASVANPAYSKAFQKLGLALGVLNKSPVYVGYDGNVHQVGQRERREIFGSSVTLSDKTGFSSAAPMRDETLTDSPGKRVDPKSRKVDGRWEFSTPSMYSAQAQAWSPAVGHYTERAIISKALEIYEKRFGKLDNNILDGHDSIGMDFAQSYHFQNILQNEAIFDVLEQDLPRKAARASLQKMKDAVQELSKLDKVTLGPNSDYSHLTDYLDDLYDSLKTMDVNPIGATPTVVNNRRKALKRNLKLLQEANQNGIWGPKGTAPNQEIAKVLFLKSNASDSSSFQVDGKAFARWYMDSFYTPAAAAGKNFLNVAPHLRENMLKATKSVPEGMRAFFRNGPDKAASQ